MRGLTKGPPRCKHGVRSAAAPLRTSTTCEFRGTPTHKLEITGFEFIEAVDGRVVVYDVNTTTTTTTTYNPDIEAMTPRSGPGEIARYLQSVVAETRGVLVQDSFTTADVRSRGSRSCDRCRG